MPRFAYSALLWALLPFVLIRLAWRSRRQRGYLARLGERFGRYAGEAARGPYIWIHAVSVGETRAASPLVALLKERYPAHRIVLTHMTPTGRATGEELFGDTVERVWLPYDFRFAVRRFLARFAPAFGLIMETELWPNLLEESARAGLPVFLVNARLSQRSAEAYARLPSLAHRALAALTGIAAQTTADAIRFQGLGALSIEVTGNIKFDLAIPADIEEKGLSLRALFGAGRRIWVIGSTRDGEEALLLDAIAAASLPDDVLVVIVPRHPQRFEEVAALLDARGLPFVRRTEGARVPGATRYVLGNTMGEMLAYYAASDVVFVGGSLKPYGGQNLIEPCAVGKPVLFGPHTFNFEQAAESAMDQGAGLRTRDARDTVAQVAALLEDRARREHMGARAKQFAQANRGALARLADWLAPRVASRVRGRG
jgi:3-deoxy-D-manno-octulosonic-acid transferase